MAIYELKTFSDLVSAVMEEVKIQSSDTVTKNRIKRDLNFVYINEVVPYANWKWLRGNTSITHEPYANTGTAEVTSGSPTITLSSAPSVGKKGLLFSVDGHNEIYRIFQHAANSTTVTLEVPFAGTTNSAANYKIWADRIPLPTELRDTVEVTHAYRSEPLEGIGLQEFRRRTSPAPKSEGRPSVYSTTDYQDPLAYSAISGLPAMVSRASSGLTRTLTFNSSVASYLREGDRIEVTASSAYQYNGEFIVSSVSGVTAVYTGRHLLDEATTADVALTVKSQNSEISSKRYKELAVYPSVDSQRTTLNVDFIKEPTPMEDDADEPLMPIGDRAVLFYGACIKAWSRERNPQEAQRNSQLFQKKLERMEGKIDDSTDFPQLKPSKTFLAAKRSSVRTRNGRFGFFDGGGGGSSGGSTTTGVANRVAEFDSSGLLTSDSTITVTELQYLDGVASSVSGNSDSATLTNKTLAVGSNSITSASTHAVAYFNASGLLVTNASLGFNSSTSVFSGPKSVLLGASEVATYQAALYLSRADGSTAVSGGNAAAAGRNIVCYGDSHATKASVLEVRSDATIQGSVSSAGLWTVGASAGSEQHVMNGSIRANVGAADVYLPLAVSSTTTGIIRRKYQNSSGSKYIEEMFDFSATNPNLSWSTYSGDTPLTIYGTGASGGGNVVINSGPIETSATDGFLYIGTMAGSPSGTPTAYTGRSPIVLDTSNGRIYFYYGGTWHYAALT